MKIYNANKLIIIATVGSLYKEWQKALSVNVKILYDNELNILSPDNSKDVRFIGLDVNKYLLILIEEEEYLQPLGLEHYLDKLLSNEEIKSIKEKYIAVHNTSNYLANTGKYKNTFKAVCDFHHISEDKDYGPFLDQLDKILVFLGKGDKDEASASCDIFAQKIIDLSSGIRLEMLSYEIHAFNNRFAALRIDSQTLNSDDENITLKIHDVMFNEKEGYLVAERDKKTAMQYFTELENEHKEILKNVLDKIDLDEADKDITKDKSKVSEVFEDIIHRNQKAYNKETYCQDVKLLIKIVDALDSALRDAKKLEQKNDQ